ncbi:MAG TPA: PilZ domain-containing protein [Solirubrobacteraceae bacterium]|nr:PilZ domain-containing protein [Solirubrobacteraceae bacterium]
MSAPAVQRREYVRVMSARPVLVYRGRDGRSVSSYTVDVSGGGMMLAGPDALQQGEQISFRLTIAQGDPPIEGWARVVRGDRAGRRCVAFTTIGDLDRRRLVRFVFERQRMERRRGLELEDGRAG